MVTTEQGNRKLEQLALAVLAAVIVGLLGWVGVSLQDAKVQSARIEERLSATNATLLEIRKGMDSAAANQADMERRLGRLESRVTLLEATR